MNEMQSETIYGLIEAADHLPIYMSEVGDQRVTIWLMSDDWEATVTVDHQGVRVTPKLGVVMSYCQAVMYESWLAGARELGERIQEALDDEAYLRRVSAIQDRWWCEVTGHPFRGAPLTEAERAALTEAERAALTEAANAALAREYRRQRRLAEQRKAEAAKARDPRDPWLRGAYAAAVAGVAYDLLARYEPWRAITMAVQQVRRTGRETGTALRVSDRQAIYERLLPHAYAVTVEGLSALEDDQEVELAPTDPDALMQWIESRLDEPAQPGLLPERRLGAFEQGQEDAVLALCAMGRGDS